MTKEFAVLCDRKKSNVKIGYGRVMGKLYLEELP